MYNHEEEFETNENTIDLNSWKLFVGPPSRSCWICGNHQYTLFFAEIDKSLTKDHNDIKLQILPQNFTKSNHCVLGMTENLELNMEPIRKFSERVDHHFAAKYNYLRHFRDEGLIDEAHRVADLEGEKLE